MRVMIIGASSDRAKFGNKAVRAFQRAGHEVVPINPNESEVEGLRTYPTVNDAPGHFDWASFYVPSRVGLKVLDQLIQRGDVDELWFNPGAESPELLQKARDAGFEVHAACSVIAIGERPI